ncbi:TonB-dependent receptor [Novosphingobium nitrogenifigens DSM 19370]|uniref:TonB-dependent receptor n=1 Tax=Novosphingobium nitrogenifigens DSM 19370 TaxID=983920 RepID=F1Z9P2_9SPHN|nr:TonB-dependent receptor [Novosphingobium nitrogenifigens]EGD58700.1 TonB-dependent receptor [Novosphingobium nitrogenifigens DSM 19370]
MTVHRLTTTASLLALATLPTLAHADAAPEPATPTQTSAAQASLANDDIVVTAQRRAEPAQNTGIALTVLTGDQLSKRGITNVNQLQDQVPNLEIVPAFGGGQPQFRLRGVGFDDYASNNAPTVGIYIDDVAYPVPAMTQSALFDIDRVEVLRGPQGTLYGRNTTGGAINFVSRTPTAQLSAGINLEYGKYDAFKGEAYISGPLSDTLRFRVSAVSEQGGGFQYNRDTNQSLGDANRTFGKATLEWRPSSAATITVSVHGGYDKSDLVGLYLTNDFQTGGYGVGTPGAIIPADTNIHATGWGFTPQFTSSFGWSANAKPGRDNMTQGGSINAAIDLSDAIRLTSITAYDYFRRAELQSWDASAANESEEFWYGNEHVFSQELRLSSSRPGKLDWVGGVYYSHQLQKDGFESDFTNSLGIVTNTHFRQIVDSISGFGQVNYHVTPAITLIGGIRYEHEDRRLRGFATDIGAYSASTPLTWLYPTFADGDRNTGFDEVSGKVGIEYRPKTGILIYANASRGVKSGGYTAYNSPYQNQIDAFQPEVLYAYELGFKGDISRAFRLNVAGFYYDYRNQQVLGTVLSEQTGLIGRITNAPKSRIYGAEAEVVVTPVKGLRITQSGSYKGGEYIRYDAVDPNSLQGSAGSYSASTISYAGQSLPIAHWSYQGSVTATIPAGDYIVEAAGDYAWRSKLPSFLGAAYDLPARWIVNANLTLRPAEGKWSVGLYGRNIFNTRYDLVRNYFLPNARVAQPGRPGTYGIQLGYHF